MRGVHRLEVLKGIAWSLLLIVVSEGVVFLRGGRESVPEIVSEHYESTTSVSVIKNDTQQAATDDIIVDTPQESTPLKGVLEGVENPMRMPPRCPLCAGKKSCTEPPLRKLRYIVSLDSDEWPNPQYCSKEGYVSLCESIKSTAVNRQLLVAVANSAAPGLAEFVSNIKEIKIPNLLIAALDEKVTHMLDDWNVSYWAMFDNVTGNHKVSAKKFGIVRKMIQLGASVLLTDTDVVYFSNPFNYLGLDTDVETMSDGWDLDTAFSFHDVITDSRYTKPDYYWPKSMRIQALNSGLWYIAATKSSDHFLGILSHRMETEDVWDQEAFFTELLSPSYEGRIAAPVSLRVLSPLCFMNSKVLMRIVRPYLLRFGYGSAEKMKAAKDHGPVALHANYHVDKPTKMKQADSLYNKHNPDGLDSCYCGSDNTCGCDMTTQTVDQLEKEHENTILSSFATSTDYRQSISFLESGCKPQPTPMKAVPAGTLQWINTTDADPSIDVTVVVFQDQNCSKSLLLNSGTVLKYFPSQNVKPVNSIKGKWEAIQQSLKMGKVTIAINDDTVLIRNPLEYTYRDCDVEVASDGWDARTAGGSNHVTDDQRMGWSRYCHGFRIASHDAGFVVFNPTVQSLQFADRLLSIVDDSADPGLEHLYFNELLFRPNFGSYRSPSVTKRTSSALCYSNAKSVMQYFRTNAAAPSPVIVRLQSVACSDKEEHFNVVTRSFTNA